jgi:hypothetical protein
LSREAAAGVIVESEMFNAWLRSSMQTRSWKNTTERNCLTESQVAHNVSINWSNHMDTKIWGLMIGLSLVASSTASGQVVSGVMTVTGAEMH